LVNRDDFGVFDGQMKHRACCVFAFCRNSHGLPE
jgi:hypothetical protein